MSSSEGVDLSAIIKGLLFLSLPGHQVICDVIAGAWG